MQGHISKWGKKNSYIDSFTSLADYNCPSLNELHIEL
jgi:hypothetical protein